MMMNVDFTFEFEEVFLDLETLDRSINSPIIEISIVNNVGDILFDETINPGEGFKLNNYKINYLGYSQSELDMSKTLEMHKPCLIEITKNKNIVTFGSRDLDLLPWLRSKSLTSDCCQRFSERYGVYSKYHSNHRWVSLKDACEYIGYKPKGIPHRSLTDAKSCREVWLWLDKQNQSSNKSELLLSNLENE
tara:strand:- start:599 stop:1171 length:573 start_codon:yes stop_codon:yes gene_type:complete